MKSFLLISISILFISSCTEKDKIEIHPEFKSYFDEYQVEGCFLIFDFQENITVIYNEERCKNGFLPASTFKIANTLIGFETGIINGKEFIIPWDSVNRQVEVWNREHNLKSAFQNSVVPWYQELARRIGTDKMQYWISKTGFGEMDVNKENIDLFWLTGKSRITPFEQLEFQKQLIKDELPFAQNHIDLVKSIMVLEKTSEYIFRGKTGWAVMDNTNIGWLVGYMEVGKEKYAYVINLESKDSDTSLFQKSRKEITKMIFKQLSLL